MGSIKQFADVESVDDEIEQARQTYLRLCERAQAANWDSEEAGALQEAADAALYALNVAEERRAAQ